MLTLHGKYTKALYIVNTLKHRPCVVVLSILTLHSKYIKAPTFENFCARASFTNHCQQCATHSRACMSYMQRYTCLGSLQRYAFADREAKVHATMSCRQKKVLISRACTPTPTPTRTYGADLEQQQLALILLGLSEVSFRRGPRQSADVVQAFLRHAKVPQLVFDRGDAPLDCKQLLLRVCLLLHLSPKEKSQKSVS